MPELPEVESVRLQLVKFLTGHKVIDTEIKYPRIFDGFEKKLIGGKVKSIRRFGKVLSIDLDNKYSIVVHVKLTGQLIYRGPKLKNPSLSQKVIGGLGGNHTLVTFSLDKGGTLLDQRSQRAAALYYNDVRRFGWIKVVKTPEVENIPFIKSLGPEPFKGLTLKGFKETLSSTKRAIKVLLMDQKKIGGVGNIYANDGLWLARIDPRRPASGLSAIEQSKLFNAIKKVLREGLKRGGASELAFVTPDGSEGNYQEHFLAYGQQGKVCNHCEKNKIEKYMLGGRGTYWCPNCQK